MMAAGKIRQPFAFEKIECYSNYYLSFDARSAAYC